MSRKLTFDERVQLMYDKGERSFEDTAVYEATTNDLNMDAVAKYVNLLGYSKSSMEYLKENNYFVTTDNNGEEVVSVACMLLFGKKPQSFLPRACCHRAYNIKGTEIQIKMFDDRIVFESPGKLSGMVRPSNIRSTHFSRNPKIAAFLKTYHYVKEYGEGVDRMYRELEVNGAAPLSFHTDDFILKVSVPKVTEKLVENRDGEAEKLVENTDKLIEKLVEKATGYGDKLTENRIAILRLIASNPYISQSELAESIGISVTAISNNIKAMRNKYLRRVGPDKGGFWEIIE